MVPPVTLDVLVELVAGDGLGEDSLLGHAVPRRVVNAGYCTLELPRSRANKKIL